MPRNITLLPITLRGYGPCMWTLMHLSNIHVLHHYYMLITPVSSPITMIVPTNMSTAQPDLMANDNNILNLPSTPPTTSHQHDWHVPRVAPTTTAIACIHTSEGAAVMKAGDLLDSKAKNWSGWAQSMALLFKLFGVQEYVLGEVTYPDPKDDPDTIAYVVNRLVSYTANPSMQHVEALKHILQYLSGTRMHSIMYKILPQEPSFFFGYTDASYGNVDDHRSISGYVFLARDGAITWYLRKQTTIALSSTKAKYVALSKAVQEACWLRSLYGKLGLLQEEVLTLIWGDNKGLIVIVKNLQFHK